MEVHHHPKVEKKNFKEYFLEFLMIFLAVTMGFFAESLHEHYNDAEIEKRNMESLVKNLQKDSLNLVFAVDKNEEVIKTIDSLTMLQGSFHDSAFQRQFYSYAIRLIYYRSFNPDESAFEQMKSSGTLRLIKHQNITDSILKYIERNKYTIVQQGFVDKWFGASLETLSQLYDYRQLFKEKSPKITGTDEQIQQYINYKIAEKFSQTHYLDDDLKVQLANVKILIPFLKKEYNIE
jgi:hypothetical protein